MRYTLMFMVLLFVVGCDDANHWPTQTFDKEKWAHTQESNRFIYVRDLIDREVLIGKSSEEVLALLGKPSNVGSNGTPIAYIVKTGGTGFDQVFVMEIRLDSRTHLATQITVRGD